MEGYAKLGAFMGTHPEHAIFRRYSALNAQNILFLQAELHLLEERLRELAYEDETSGNWHRRKYSRDWYFLSESSSPQSAEGEDSRQWQLFLKIRGKLKEYSIHIFLAISSYL
jgi:hypothetical protein